MEQPPAAPPAGLRVLHVDLDAFFAAVEQRQRPSLRGRPVIVGGVTGRGVVATASYEARKFGIASAMPMERARRACPDGVFLPTRFEAYRQHSVAALAWLADAGATVEQVAFDEAFVDLATVPAAWWDPVPGQGPATDALEPARRLAGRVRSTIHARTGLTSSVGVGRSKLTAKLGSEAGKPAGITVLDAAAEEAMLPGLDVRALFGVGPATAARLAGEGIRTVADLRAADERTLRRLLGPAHATLLAGLAHGHDPRPVVADSERKSVGAEHTLEHDLRTGYLLADAVRAAFADAHLRLRRAQVAARTVTVKVRYADFTDVSRSETVPAPSDEGPVLLETALRAARRGVDPERGIRLVGVTFSSLTGHSQPALIFPTGDRFIETDLGDTLEAPGALEPPNSLEGDDDPDEARSDRPGPVTAGVRVGADGTHPAHGAGWVVAVTDDAITVRFETPDSAAAPDTVLPLPAPEIAAAPPPPAGYPG